MNRTNHVMQIARQQGRGPDSELVHMSPKEVGALQGLAQIHGGSLTRNPHTGLPEAGFLDNILPAVIGIGASMIPGVGPLAAGALAGGVTALTSGSLEKGLVAGLGAFGGANLASGLGSVGNAAAQASPSALAGGGANAAQSLVQEVAPSAVQSLGQTMPQTAGALASGAPTAGLDIASQAASAMTPQAAPQVFGLDQVMPNIPQGASPMSSHTMTPPPMQAPPAGQQSGLGSFMDSMGDMGRGAKQLFTGPNEAIGPDGQSAIDMMGGYGGVAMNTAMAAAPFMHEPYGEGEEDFLDPDRGYIRPYTFHRNRIEGAGPGERRFEQWYEEHDPVRPEEYDGQRRFFTGGLVQHQQSPFHMFQTLTGLGGSGGESSSNKKELIEFTRTPIEGAGPGERRFKQEFTTRTYTDADKAAGRTPYEPGLEYDAAGNPKRPRSNINPFMSLFGQEDLRHRGITPMSSRGPLGTWGSMMPQQYAQGGLLAGPGDGLSDDIPAIIDGVQPAALSTDEFVIPADVVSALGNGSSEAGAKELHAMMERIRARAHGKKTQQKPVDPEEVLPE